MEKGRSDKLSVFGFHKKIDWKVQHSRKKPKHEVIKNMIGNVQFRAFAATYNYSQSWK